MTDLMDPIDTGEIPATETRTRPIVIPRIRNGGEVYTAGRLRTADTMVFRIPDEVIDLLRAGEPFIGDMRPTGRDAWVISGEIAPYASYSPEPGEPPRPIPKPPTPPPPAAAETVAMSLFDSLTGWMDDLAGDQPKPPRPLPNPGPPPKPAGFTPRHRAVESVWTWAAGGALTALASAAVLVGAALAVVL